MRVLQIKERSVKQGLILVAGSINQFAPFLENLKEDQIQRLNLSWPGPVTFLVPDHGVSPDFIRENTQRLRCASPLTQLCSLCVKCSGGQLFRPQPIDLGSRQRYLSQRLLSSSPAKWTLLSLAH